MGILLYFSSKIQPSSLMVGALLGGATLCLYHRFRTLIGISFFIICLGMSVAHLRTLTFHTWMIDRPFKNFSFTGTVQEQEVTAYGMRLIIALKDLASPYQDLHKIRLTVKKDVRLPPMGSEIKGEATLLPFGSLMGESGYNFRRVAYFQGLSATGQLHDYQQIKDPSQPFSVFLKGVRQTINNNIRDQFSSHPEVASIVSALVTGIRGTIPNPIRQAFTDAGLAHLLAISGLHLSLIAGFVFFVIRRGLALSMILAESYPLKKVAALFTIPLLSFYLVISGAGIPALRAFLMIVVGMIAIFLDRNPFSMRLVCFAATVVLFLYPESLLSASFQLSFAAVVALIGVYEKGEKWFKKGVWEGRKPPKITLYLAGVIATTLIASFATTPFTIAIFQRFSLQGVLGNLIAIPLTGFVIMPLIVVFLLLMPWGGDFLIAPALKIAIQFLIKVALEVSYLPGAAILLPEQSSLFLLLFTMGGLWFCLWQQRWCYIGVGIMFLSFGCLRLTAEPKIVIPERGNVIYGFDGRQAFCLGCKQSGFFDELFLRQVGRSQMVRYADKTTSLSLQNKHVFLTIETLPRKKLQTACRQSDFMVSPRSIAYACLHNGHVFDRQTLLQSGNLILHFTGRGTVDIQTSCHWQGCRPWSEAKCCQQRE